MSQDSSKDAFLILRKDFDLPELKESFDEEQAILFLSKAVSQLLDRDFERLLQICYRIDLGEEKLKKILHESKPDQVSLDLARALWERQKLKIEIRKRYS
ncbi:MAG: hypothetical protein P8O16_17245 [Algoriphagus sp.]|uniref:hypothetical protein n=1 Tax=Algoriphagus sp. TaxID=1872435 RepID=UPI00260F66CB|nr:hypothetical protein [Algoriphagus sp.]MDG1279028.1 hypothetical protein [Algoriphagus sp.]